MGLRLSAIVCGVYIADNPDSMISHSLKQVKVTMEGFEGDKHAGLSKPSSGRSPHYPRGTIVRNSRQVSLVSLEELQEIASILGLPEIRAEWMGANVLVQGIPSFSSLPPNTRLFFKNDVTLIVFEENVPCAHLADVIMDQYPQNNLTSAEIIKASVNRRGSVAWVERAGIIANDDSIQVEIPEFRPYLI